MLDTKQDLATIITQTDLVTINDGEHRGIFFINRTKLINEKVQKLNPNIKYSEVNITENWVGTTTKPSIQITGKI